jgi:predicted ester cyclase
MPQIKGTEMTGTSKSSRNPHKTDAPTAAYGIESDLVDFILGITFEIWEQGQVELIHNYYAEKVEVFSLDSMTTSATRMVENTYKTIETYPDRLLLADDVITKGTSKQGFSSHRLVSPMTNLGESIFGPATGRQILAMNIADCEVNDGLITREWLVRDNLAVIRQLGLDALICASVIAEHFDERQTSWLASEFARTVKNQTSASSNNNDSLHSFVRDTLGNCWIGGDNDVLESSYAPYCVMHRAPLQIHSGREALLKHYAGLRLAFPNASLSIDHVCSQPFDKHNQRIAVRWSVAATHEGEFANQPATGKPVYILGVTHWQLVDGRITAEWTVFDELAVLAQTLV